MLSVGSQMPEFVVRDTERQKGSNAGVSRIDFSI